ncbi:uncharacterized protein M421DRAFT_398980 [Didymella exigua CBS 183.55]|uniref:DDE-1 domain-containing protein n=1 Tax=Didymella exigua CBS 183.55 TaxID=1150837 RepID=A0A6A5RYB1_9PLEO|nr:uncharacterized protein M421DRAFT_398980 [Didymella exigua CBS 183.55]KAF1932603.1 hypothetical protein M421DRAFT_398980 [Didymella exigua CBS 183.55]
MYTCAMPKIVELWRTLLEASPGACTVTVACALFLEASRALAQALPPGVADTCANRSEYGSAPLSTVIHRDHGRRSREEQAESQQYLSREEEISLVRSLQLKSTLGQPVRIKFIRSLAFSIARQRTTLEKQHPQLQAKRGRSIDWKRQRSNIHEKVVEWFNVIGQVLQDPSVVLENVYNIDKTGVILSMLGSVKVMVGKDDQQNNRRAGVKHTIHYAHSKNGYNDTNISLEWLTRVFNPQTRGRAKGKPRVLVVDGFGTHETLEILEFCLSNNIVERLNRGGVDTVGKEHFPYLCGSARDRAITKSNIRARWAATGLFLFNPKRVPKGIPKPPAKLVIPRVKVSAGPCLLAEMVHTPVPPVTLVAAEALTMLHDMIKDDTQTLGEASRQCVQRRIQKLASAARISFAERALPKLCG